MAEQISSEQTIAMIEQTATDKGRDAFRVRVLRRTPNRILPDAIATFDNVTAEQITHCDTWLSRLAGGGEFMLQAFHMDAKAHLVGGGVTVKVAGEPRDVDANVVRRTDWVGPVDLVSPRPAVAQPGAQPSYMLGIPGDPTVPPPRNDGQGSGVSGALPSSNLQPSVFRPDPVLEAQRMTLERQREELASRERAMAEDRHRAEMDTMRRQTELELAKLRAELAGKPAPQTDGTDKLALILVELQKSQQESTRQMMDLVQRMNDKQTELILKATEKKDDPLTAVLLQRALDTSEKQAEGYAKMMAASSEAQGSAMNMMLGAMNAISEMQGGGGDQEPASIRLTKLIVQGISSIAEGMKANATAAAITPQRLPRPRPAPIGDANGAARPAPRPAPRPVPQAAPVAPPQPARRPVSRGPSAPIQQFAGVDDGGPSATRFQQLIAAIKSKDDPRFVASWFLNNLEEPTIAAEMARAEGNVLVAFAPYLASWLQQDEANQTYVRELVLEVKKQGEARGFTIELPAEVAQAAEEAEQEQEQDEEEEQEEGTVEEVDVAPEAPGAEAGEEDDQL